MEGPDLFDRRLCSRAVMVILDNNNTADGIVFSRIENPYSTNMGGRNSNVGKLMSTNGNG
eukprot:1474068-Ditylum_brightwellii.AAC.1